MRLLLARDKKIVVQCTEVAEAVNWVANWFEVVDVRTPEIFESPGSDRVVVLSTVHFKVRKTGEELDYPFCQVVRVDLEKGVITEMHPYYWDVAGVNKALGYEPGSKSL